MLRNLVHAPLLFLICMTMPFSALSQSGISTPVATTTRPLSENELLLIKDPKYFERIAQQSKAAARARTPQEQPEKAAKNTNNNQARQQQKPALQKTLGNVFIENMPLSPIPGDPDTIDLVKAFHVVYDQYKLMTRQERKEYINKAEQALKDFRGHHQDLSIVGVKEDHIRLMAQHEALRVIRSDVDFDNQINIPVGEVLNRFKGRASRAITRYYKR